ncbi:MULTISPECIES: HNH endonuclease [unclassified Achromobacter]|uniref:HNH endonuclease n=1 Tax=unclassified Achromobacter TaxID=2626865 RepID=UPI001303A622|nr:MULTISPECIES: HNH endonuclease [unclassified Achromobacter]
MSKFQDPTLDASQVESVLDYDAITGEFRWKVASRNGAIRPGCRAGYVKGGYQVISIRGRHIYAHRLAWLLVTRAWPSLFVDHLNGDKLDNRFANLREATLQVNNQNLHGANARNKTSGLLGVTWNRGKWTAQITIPGKGRTYLGRFTDPAMAHQAYLEAKRKYHEGCTI